MNVLNVPPWAWAATAAALAVLLGADLFVSARRRRPVRLAEAALWTAAVIAAAVAFGVLIAAVGNGEAAGQFFAGWLTEYSLSLDNLLVFILLIGRSGVPSQYHSRVLLLGILLALLMRGVLIGLGGVALHRFAWVEYLFGAVLIYAAARMTQRRGGGADPGEPPGGRRAGGRGGPAAGSSGPLRVARRIVPVAAEGDGARLTTRVRGRWHATPLLILLIAIGLTDVLFAVDSIPAVFGLTRDPFLVFSANLFALLGLRHLYFLVGGLLDRLVHLSAGLAVILGFIGIKLVSEALHGDGVHHLGPVPVPHVSAGMSVAIIAGVLAVTTVTSLAARRRRPDEPGAGQPAAQRRRAGRPGRAGGAEGEGRPAAEGHRPSEWADRCGLSRAGPAAAATPGQRRRRPGQVGGRRPVRRPSARRGHAPAPRPGRRRPSLRWPAW
jgi:tellurite resistance protein TerC